MKKLVLVFIFCLPILVGCARPTSGKIPDVCIYGSVPCLQGKVIIEVKTNKGLITLEVDGENSPLTAGNFVDLVERKVYEKTVFHRVIKTPIPFVVQGGDPISSNPSISKNSYGSGSFVDPLSGQARFVPLEMKLKGEDFPRYSQLINNPSDLIELKLRHQRGSLAMARSKELDSASAQFYISLKSLPELDGRYSVFGKVIKGMDIVENIEQGDIIISTQILSN